MVWSYSSSRAFQRCQRQWFIKYHYANSRAKKDPKRREAYLFSTLQSLPAWRGSIVDTTITKNFILPISWGNSVPSKNDLLRAAWRLFRNQLDFAKQNRAWEPNMTKTKAGDDFAALFPVAYNGDMSTDILDKMWEDIQKSLENFRDSTELIDLITSSSKLIAQRPLTFSLDGTSVKMIPDLIAFYSDSPPIIIDWKVQKNGYHNARRQLATYAVALVSCNPHKDFPRSLLNTSATDIQLLEVQLLQDQKRFYKLSTADVEVAISHIVRTKDDMQLATMGEPKTLKISDFPTTSNPSICETCNVREICWE